MKNIVIMIVLALAFVGCSFNQVTGQKQFEELMSLSAENSAFGKFELVDYSFDAGMYAIENKLGNEYVEQAYSKCLEIGGKRGIFQAARLAELANWAPERYVPLYQKVADHLNAKSAYCQDNPYCEIMMANDKESAKVLAQKYNFALK